MADIRHKTDLDKEELQKNQAHMALQKFCEILQDKDDKVMTHLDQKIVLLQQKIETGHLNKVKELAKDGIDLLPPRDLEQRKLLDEYFELLTCDIERSMEKLDMVCKIAPNDPDDTKRKKISITLSDQTLIKARKAWNVVGLIENMLSRALQDMEEIQQDRKNGIKNSQQTLKVTTLIAHIQKATPTRIQQANLVNQDIQEIIDNATEKELEAELKT